MEPKSPLSEIDFDATPEGLYYTPRPNGFVLAYENRPGCKLVFSIPITLLFALITAIAIGKQLYAQKDDMEFMILGLVSGLITLILLWALLYSLYGESRLTIHGNKGEIFEGIGNWGSTQEFNLDEITRIEERDVGGDTVNYNIVLFGQNEFTFGGGMNVQQRKFTMEVLKKITGLNKP